MVRRDDTGGTSWVAARAATRAATAEDLSIVDLEAATKSEQMVVSKEADAMRYDVLGVDEVENGSVAHEV